MCNAASSLAAGASIAGIPHHLFDLLPPSDMFNAGDWVDAAWEVTADIIKVRRPSTAPPGDGD